MARDVSLMRIVLASCSHLAHRPFLVGLGPAGCDHAGLREGARSGGLIYLDCDITGRTGASQLWAAAKPALDISL